MKKRISTLLMATLVMNVVFALYIGNLRSWKFHHIGCKWERRMWEENRFYTYDRNELIEMGMQPCHTCMP